MSLYRSALASHLFERKAVIVTGGLAAYRVCDNRDDVPQVIKDMQKQP